LTDDWKCDGYRWRDSGHRKQSDGAVDSIYYRIKCADGVKSTFTKHVYWLVGNDTVKIVHYKGDESVYKESAHGNARNPNKIFEPAKPSSKQKLINELKYKDAHVVYKNNEQLARNLKQCQNIKQELNAQKR
jgi:hypothetical protein